jgi:hypothetical protein
MTEAELRQYFTAFTAMIMAASSITPEEQHKAWDKLLLDIEHLRAA